MPHNTYMVFTSVSLQITQNEANRALEYNLLQDIFQG